MMGLRDTIPNFHQQRMQVLIPNSWEEVNVLLHPIF